MTCYLQIFDMLWAAGLTQDDRRLPEPFDINRVCPAALEQLLEVIKVPVGSRDMAGCASQELLAGIVKRAKWSESPATEAVWVHKLNCNTSRSFSPAIENLPSVKFCTPNLRAGKSAFAFPTGHHNCCRPSPRAPSLRPDWHWPGGVYATQVPDEHHKLFP